MKIRNRFGYLLNLLFIFLLFSPSHTIGFAGNSQPASPENIDSNLINKLESIVIGFAGDIGIYVRHLPSGRTAAIRADELFPTASMIKLPILLTIMDRIDSGQLDYHGEQIYRDSLLYPGEDILGSFKDGEKIALSKLVMLMISMSDNTASLWCQRLAGTGTEINNWLAGHGFEQTRVNSRTAGRKEDWQNFGWGQTTAREMTELLVMIREGRAVSPAASEEMYRVLGNVYWNSEALSQIPPYIQAASKQGAVDESRSEVMLVNAPSGDYVFCVITNNQKDKSRDYSNEGFVLIRKISKLLWQYFEPESGWEPATGSEKWAK